MTVHPAASHEKRIAAFARLLPLRYDVLMFDLPESELSMDSNHTLAHHEPRVLLDIYELMPSKGYAPDEMAMLGNSMGPRHCDRGRT